MNIKLIIASILGIGSLGGAVAGGYYLLNPENSQKDISDSESKSSENSGTPKSAVAEQPVPATPNALPSQPAALTPSPSSKARKGPASAPGGSVQPQSTEVAVQRDSGDGGTQKTRDLRL